MTEKLRKIYVKWFPSTSPDVVGYKIYYEKSPTPVSFTSAFADAGMPALVDGKMSFDLAMISAFASDEDVRWNLGIAAVDDEGHESVEVLADVPLDLIAPAAPTGLEIVRV